MPKKFEGTPSQEGAGGEKGITSDAWQRGERPRGYEETTTVIRMAYAYGLNLDDLFTPSFLSERDTLVQKAGAEGLTQAEADRIVEISKEVNQKLREALDAAASKKK